MSVSIFRFLAGTLLAAAALFVVVGYRNATRDPVVRHLTVTTPDYPKGAAAVRIVLLSDIHVQGPDMPPARLARIVDQIDALEPDIVLVAGDFRGNSGLGVQYSPEQAAAPLRRLKAPLGAYAVFGNNDSNVVYYLEPALERAGVHVLANEAARVGPLALGGIDGRFYRTEPALGLSRAETYRALAATPGVKVLLAHGPDEFAAAPSFVRLVLAGHTHCGQIVIPLLGALVTGSKYGQRFVCGVYRAGSRALVVSGGLGTSHVPLRIGAPADIWLITVSGPKATH